MQEDLRVLLDERESERTAFINYLRKEIKDAEERFGRRRLEAGLIVGLAGYLRDRGQDRVGPPLEALVSGPVQDFLKEGILLKIEQFSIVPAEQDVIAGEVLEIVVESFIVGAHSELLRITIHERQEFLTHVGKIK